MKWKKIFDKGYPENKDILIGWKNPFGVLVYYVAQYSPLIGWHVNSGAVAIPTHWCEIEPFED